MATRQRPRRARAITTEGERERRVVRPWPEAADSARLRQISPGIYQILQAVKHFVYDGDAYDMTRDTLIQRAAKFDRHKTQAMAGLGILITDGVLVDKSGDGILKLDLSKLENQIEIYNETP